MYFFFFHWIEVYITKTVWLPTFVKIYIFLCSPKSFLYPKSFLKSLKSFTNNPFTKQIFVSMFFTKSDNCVAWKTWSYKWLGYRKVTIPVDIRWRGDGKKACTWETEGEKRKTEAEKKMTKKMSKQQMILCKERKKVTVMSADEVWTHIPAVRVADCKQW